MVVPRTVLLEACCVLWVLRLLGTSRFHPAALLAFAPEAVYDKAG